VETNLPRNITNRRLIETMAGEVGFRRLRLNIGSIDRLMAEKKLMVVPSDNVSVWTLDSISSGVR
jgi:hypothetical protein